MEDSGATPRHALDWSEFEPPAPRAEDRSPTMATTTEPGPSDGTPTPPAPVFPISSGASVSRPTSSHAALLRSLRALGLTLEDAIEPGAVAPGQVAAGPGAAFAVPGLTVAEPAFAQAVDWMLCAALADVGAGGPGAARAYYFRHSARPLDPAPFEAARARVSDAVLRRQLLLGCYRLVESCSGARTAVQIAAVGPTMPEVLAAAAQLEGERIGVHIIDVASPDAVYAAWQRAMRRAVLTSSTPALPGVLRQAFDAALPIVAVHDQSSVPLSWLGAAVGVPIISVPTTGAPGDVGPVTTDAIVSGALASLSL